MLEGPVPRAARAHHPDNPGVQADAHGRRLLAGQRKEPAAAADLRHRLGVQAALDAYLNLLEEAEKRDHRRLGAELDLFSFPTEIGAGLAVWHPKGGIVRRVMEDYARSRHEAAGYQFVNTPHVTKEELFQTSGHLGCYAEGMYPPMEWTARRTT